MCAGHDAGNDQDAAEDDAGEVDGSARPDGGGGAAGHEVGGSGGGVDASATDADGSAADAPVDAGEAGTCPSRSPLDIWTSEQHDGVINGIWAARADSVWLALETSVRHWDGSVWTTVLVALPSERFGSIWATDDGEVWVTSTLAGIKRWNGSVWADVAPPGYLPPVDAGNAKLWGRDARDVWVNTFLDPSSILHWDGIAWADRTPPAWGPPSGARFVVRDVWAASANDVWAVGSRNAPSLLATIPSIMHWNGTAWDSELNPPPDPSGVQLSLEGIWGSSATDAWVAAYIWKRQAMEMWHYDGNSWRATDDIFDLLPTSIWGSCAGDVWVAGYNAHTQARVARFDGLSWTAGMLGSETSRVIGLSGTTPDDLWVAGTNVAARTGIVFHSQIGSAVAACGNVRLDPGEQCDPPNLYTCDPGCNRIPVCGDGALDPGEQCDPPDGLSCDSSCRTIPTCGNLRIDPGEQCDPPGPGMPACDQNCQLSSCGNGQLDPGEQCDPPRQLPAVAPWCDSRCQIPRCGNGVVDPGETCDPPSGGWLPGHGSPFYCGNDCTNHDACAECHQRCDSDPRGFEVCKCEYCMVGPYGPCGGCTL